MLIKATRLHPGVPLQVYVASMVVVVGKRAVVDIAVVVVSVSVVVMVALAIADSIV